VTDFDFTGRRVVVTGGATGVGAALLDLLAELGAADVTVLDIKVPAGPHTTFLETNLAERDAVDAAIARIDGDVDALFNNAGVANTMPSETVFRINVLAPIRLTEALLPRMGEGATITTTSSVAGLAWPQRLPVIQELLALDGWDAMFDWFEGRDVGVDTYSFTKEVMQVWTMRRAHDLMERGIRINSVAPSPIDTPLAPDFRQTIGDAGIDFTIKHSGGRMVSAREVASVLAFLASPAASFVSGQNLNVDFGFQASMITGTLDTSSVRASAGRG
jgi:NAD(P)-dependent dehydrogenase (short-subunit alcohol dehydrogenase family)